MKEKKNLDKYKWIVNLLLTPASVVLFKNKPLFETVLQLPTLQPLFQALVIILGGKPS